MRSWRCVAMVGMIALSLASPAAVGAYECDEGSSFDAGCGGYLDRRYDDYTDSHPLRIAAYAIHPIGYALEWLVTRPIHALVSQPDLDPIFGYTSERLDFCCGIPSEPEGVAYPLPPPAPVVSTADAEAARRAAEDAKRAAEDAKRAAEAAERAADKATRGFEKSLTK